MGYFDQIAPGGMGQPSASAFTSPGMNPQQLALLQQMQNRAGGGGMPGMGMPTGGMPQTPMAPGMGGAPAGGVPPQLAALMQSNPALARQILAMLMQRGPAGMPGAAPGGAPSAAPAMPPSLAGIMGR